MTNAIHSMNFFQEFAVLPAGVCIGILIMAWREEDIDCYGKPRDVYFKDAIGVALTCGLISALLLVIGAFVR